MATFTRHLRRIRQHFKPRNLIDICERNICDFGSFGKVVQYGVKDFYIYKDNGASVLGIAHLDTVQDVNTCDVAFTKDRGPIVLSPALDDRLGAWVITDLLPRLGVKIDWLLTTGEESASSTGMDFARDHKANGGKQYNWMFQFDRTGTDVVMYDYDCKELRELLKSVGMTPANGSFSDISNMESMGCKAFNVGVGYQNYHSKRAYAWLDDTFMQVARFLKFYHFYGDLKLPHVETTWQSWVYRDATGKEYKGVFRTKNKRNKDKKKKHESKYVPSNLIPHNNLTTTQAFSQYRTDEEWVDIDQWIREHEIGPSRSPEEDWNLQGF